MNDYDFPMEIGDLVHDVLIRGFVCGSCNYESFDKFILSLELISLNKSFAVFRIVSQNGLVCQGCGVRKHTLYWKTPIANAVVRYLPYTEKGERK